MNWDNVEMIRNAQASAKARFEATALATQEELQKVVNSEAAKSITMPRLSELEQMIFKMRSELIDYIVAHGLVDGLIWDGVLQPIQNGKIVITKEMIEILTEHLGYFTEADVQAFLEMYLPENHYVSDASYVHTDNNYTTPEKDKLAGIEDGAEVNKIIDVIFNGVSVLDDGTRIATINITPEDIKRWYESNPDTNAFTDAAKAKLAGISDGAEVNRVDDVLVNGRSVLNENKKALITKEIVKDAYEANEDTNAFADAEKEKLYGIEAGAQVNKVEDVQLDGVTVVNAKKQAILTGADIKKSYEAQPDTNAFTDAEKAKLDGIEAGAQVNKVEDVLLDGTTVVNAKKQAVLTGADIKKSYEAQPDTNAFTDAEKAKLDELDKWKPNAETEIASNSAEIAEAKKSISALGDETDAIAGRVTTLEDSAVRDVLLNGVTTVDPETHKATLTAEGIKAAYEANADTNAFTDAEKAKLEGIDAANYVPYTGASKNVDLGDHTISCAAPTADVHAANKAYVDAAILTRLPVHNVKAYGAKGDGQTDDRLAIANACKSGGIVYFPPGTYLTTATITIKKPSTIVGFGDAVIKCTAQTDVIVATAAINVSGLEIVGPDTTSGTCIKASNHPVLISSSKFSNAKTAIAILNETNHEEGFCIRDCNISNTPVGVSVFRTTAGTITGVTLNGTTDIGVEVEASDYTTIENCKFKDNGKGVAARLRSKYLKVSNCTFLNSSSNDILLGPPIDMVTICGNSFIGQDSTSWAVFGQYADVSNVIVTNNIMKTRRVKLTGTTSNLVVNNLEV